jgi:tRNA (mo5U34)-methyltransferase
MGKTEGFFPSNAALREINGLLDWRAATLLPDGRMVGRTFARKRAKQQAIPDHRIALLDQMMPLSGRRVLEIGCFEGIHTLGLMHYGADVTAIDVRPINVIKTLTRASMHGFSVRAFVGDAADLSRITGHFDLVFHFGVLYHMMNPVEHLASLSAISDALFVDTHIAGDRIVRGAYCVDGEHYDFDWRDEAGWSDPFSGTGARSRQLTMECLDRALVRAGFLHRRLVQRRAERNGPRVLLLASKHAIADADREQASHG